MLHRDPAHLRKLRRDLARLRIHFCLVCLMTRKDHSDKKKVPRHHVSQEGRKGGAA